MLVRCAWWVAHIAASCHYFPLSLTLCCLLSRSCPITSSGCLGSTYCFTPSWILLGSCSVLVTGSFTRIGGMPRPLGSSGRRGTFLCTVGLPGERVRVSGWVWVESVKQLPSLGLKACESLMQLESLKEPVVQCCVYFRHIYYPLTSYGYSRLTGQLAVFVISAFFHEVSSLSPIYIIHANFAFSFDVSIWWVSLSRWSAVGLL